MYGRTQRSIPAHAGEPWSIRLRPLDGAVYPRPRGGTAAIFLRSFAAPGLSPPTRGNRGDFLALVRRARSIPAHAGEPVDDDVLYPANAVYPRPRGGTARALMIGGGEQGLSPPTRGNPRTRHQHLAGVGSIPAHAGEPRPPERGHGERQVYPRPRGGTTFAVDDAEDIEGLSPPTRGNPLTAVRIGETTGSIPAHAGEPSAWKRLPSWRGVYPRPRGGTAVFLYADRHDMGLSPPTRGNLSDDERERMLAGLSPPTRGNRRVARVRALAGGSIPAHAGEPVQRVAVRGGDEVYPRPRGGTVNDKLDLVVAAGLSPPTRGNPPSESSRRIRGRSIPAHAGEPARRAPSSALRRVYPRPRGGTIRFVGENGQGNGLSPPTRGNPNHRPSDGSKARSIPAHAGEPQVRACTLRPSEVYPRPRGGTLDQPPALAV